MIYTTSSGDEWDGICYKVYGDGGEMMMHDVMHANLEHIDKVVFPAGIVLQMPTYEARVNKSDLPPWMR